MLWVAPSPARQRLLQLLALSTREQALVPIVKAPLRLGQQRVVLLGLDRELL